MVTVTGSHLPILMVSRKPMVSSTLSFALAGTSTATLAWDLPTRGPIDRPTGGLQRSRTASYRRRSFDDRIPLTEAIHTSFSH